MDILEHVIGSLTSDEVRRFKILSNRFRAEEEKKLLVLFDAIRSGEHHAAEDKIIQRLYQFTTAQTKNSYYRLRNKLLGNLEKSLLFYHFNYRNSLESLSYLQLSMLFRERALFRESYYYLRKAERLAEEFDQFSLLETIYDEMIKLAAHVEVDIEVLISRRRENLKKLEILRGNSEILGMITQRLSRRNFARTKGSISVIQTLEEIRGRLEEHQEIFKSAQGRIMIIRAVVAILIQKSAYAELATYAWETYQEFLAGQLFTRETHNFRLILSVWRINSLHKLLRLDEARQGLALLWEDLQLHQRMHFGEYGFHYYSQQTLNYKLTGHLPDAGKTLEALMAQKDILRNPAYEHYIRISEADQMFCEGNPAGTATVLESLLQDKTAPAQDESRKMYLQVFLLIAYVESAQQTLAQDLAAHITRQFKPLLKEEEFGVVKRLVSLLEKILEQQLPPGDARLKTLVRRFMTQYTPQEIGDNQIILYDVYLRARQDARPYYDCLIEEVQRRQEG
ncbi:MAG: hypothetical protein SF053_05785 [Bacteroidia bacterium]|nr:hypothetical protein [Bacteroidia bacterium]